MKPRITVITIGVDDLERSLSFYRDGLGLKTDGIVGEDFEYSAVVFIDLENGANILDKLPMKDSPPPGYPGMVTMPTGQTISQNTLSQQPWITPSETIPR